MVPALIPARDKWMSATWAAIATVVVVAGFSGLATWRWQRSRGLTARSEMHIAHAQAVQADLIDMETGQRGFLLTGVDEYLAPYRRAAARLTADLDSLTANAEGDKQSGAYAATIVNLARRKAAELDSTIVIASAGQHDAALALVRTNRGQGYMDSLRLVLGDLTRGERMEQRSHVEDEDRWAVGIRLVLLVGTLLTLGVLLFLRSALTNYSSLQAISLREMERQLSDLESMARERGTRA